MQFYKEHKVGYSHYYNKDIYLEKQIVQLEFDLKYSVVKSMVLRTGKNQYSHQNQLIGIEDLNKINNYKINSKYKIKMDKKNQDGC